MPQEKQGYCKGLTGLCKAGKWWGSQTDPDRAVSTRLSREDSGKVLMPGFSLALIKLQSLRRTDVILLTGH